jgi:hypothetical protein
MKYIFIDIFILKGRNFHEELYQKLSFLFNTTHCHYYRWDSGRRFRGENLGHTAARGLIPKSDVHDHRAIGIFQHCFSDCQYERNEASRENHGQYRRRFPDYKPL